MKKRVVFLLVAAVILNYWAQSFRRRSEKRWTVLLLVIAVLLGCWAQSLRKKSGAEEGGGNG